MTFALPNWRLIVFSVGFFILFVNLGIWQYSRAGEKEVLLAAAAAQAAQPGEILSPELDVSLGDPVRTIGQFQPEMTWLADNKVLDGRVGFEVVQLFRTTTNLNILVNRGFIVGGRTRADLPEIPAPLLVPQSIRGHLYLSELPVPEQNTSGSTYPLVTQVVNPDVLEARLKEDLYPFVLRLEESHPDALPRYWPVTTMPPERHMGYAITWFTMAVAIALALGFSSVRRVKIETENIE